MSKYSRLGLLSFAMCAGAAVMLATPVFAEDPTPTVTPEAATTTEAPSTVTPRLDLGISVSPVKFIFDANPGETLTGTLTYYNATGTDLSLYLYANNFKSDNNTGNPQFIEEDLPFTSSLKDWIKFPAESFTIKKVEETNTNALQVKFSVTIPADAEAGGYYAAIMATINDPKKKLEPQGGNIAFSADTGALVLLNVKGNVNRNLKLNKFTTVDPFSKTKNEVGIYEWMPAEFLIDLENTGNSHAFPLGNIIINQGDREVQNIQFNKSQSAILRESTRQYYQTMDTGFVYLEPVTETVEGKVQNKIDANGNTDTKLSFNLEKASKQFIGPFSAKLLLVYDDNGVKKTIIADKEFWVFPWKVAAIVVGVISLYALVKIRSKRD